jgi:small subunit ribosomal protein S21
MKRYNSSRPAHVTVEVREGQSITTAIKKFMKKVKRSGIIEEYRRSLEYEKPSDKRKRKDRRREKVLKKLRQNRK